MKTETGPAAHERGIECAEFCALDPALDWRTDPGAWIAEHIGTVRAYDARENESVVSRAFAALSGLLEPYGSAYNPGREILDDSLALARVLSAAHELLKPLVRAEARFLRFGELLLPTTPSALSALSALRAWADDMIHGNRLAETVGPFSALGSMLAGLDSPAPVGALYQGWRNKTSKPNPADGYYGFRISVKLHSRCMASLPRGTKLPPPLLVPDPVGFHVDDPLAMQRECDMCDDGVAQFLDEFGIGHERLPGEYQCDSCGSSCEDEDEGGTIESIDPFTLTADMLDYAYRQGFGDRVREYVSGESEIETLGDLLEESADETLARLAPDAEHGIRFDAAMWSFDPTFGDIEGADDVKGADALNLGARLLAVATYHVGAGVLPPIPGTLTYLHPASNTSSKDAISLEWDPDAGILTSRITDRVELRWDVRAEAAVLALRSDGGVKIVNLRWEGGEWILHAPPGSGGDDAALMLAIVQGEAEI